MTAQSRKEAAKRAWETMRAKGWKPKNKKIDVGPLERTYLEKQNKVKLTPLKAKAAKPATAEEMSARAIALVLTFSGIGNRRQVDISEIELKKEAIGKTTDKDWLALSKQLIDAKELEAISSLDGEARRYIESRALPLTLKKGVYLVSYELVEEVTARLTDFRDRRAVLVKQLISVYSRLVKEAEVRLGHLFDASEYPTVERIAEAFQLKWRFIGFNTPVNLKDVNPELYEQERKKAEADWKETREAIEELLRSQLSELVTSLIDKLTPDAAGKQKIVRDSALAKITDFLATFDPKNITNYAALKPLVDRAKSITAGLDPELLRSSDDTREYVKKGFTEINKLLEPMMVDKPRRRIVLEDEA